MRKIKDFFTLKDVEDLPPYLQERILGSQANKTRGKIDVIKDMLDKGCKQIEIAKKLNLSRQAVNHLIKVYIKGIK